MKNVIWCLAVVGLVWLTACDDLEKTTNQIEEPETVEQYALKEGKKSTSMYLPPEIQVEKGEDDIFHLTGGDGWVYIGYNEDGKFTGRKNKEISISCRCTEQGYKGGCSPWFATGMGQEAFGCASTGCSQCAMTIRTNSNLSNGGWVNLNEGVVIDPFTTAGVVFPAMMNLPELLDSMAAFYSYVYGYGNSAPDPINNNGLLTAPPGHILAPGTIFGRSTIFVLPDNDPRFMALMAGWKAIDAKCWCSGGGDCKLIENKVVLGKLFWCKSTCEEDCTLEIKMGNANGQISLLELVNYEN